MIAECPLNLENVRGGLEAASINLILGLRNLPVILRVVSIRNDLTRNEIVEVADNIHIHYYTYTWKNSKILEFLLFGNKKIKSLYHSFRPDIVHMQGTGPVLLMLRGLDKHRIVITQHGILQEELKYKTGVRKKLKFFVKAWFDKFLLTQYHHYISISHYNRMFLLALHGSSSLHTQVIYNAVNPVFFSSTPGGQMNKLIFIGLVNKLKGVHILLEALHLLAMEGIYYSLDIVGGTKEPGYVEEIKRTITRLDLGKCVILHGWKNQKEVRNLLLQSAILILPSLQECLPISIAEAMAVGRVVVATQTGGIPEMFNDFESGFLFSKNDSKQLSEILKYLHFHPEVMVRVAINAKVEAQKKYSPSKVAEQTLQFYRATQHQSDFVVNEYTDSALKSSSPGVGS
jgi:glycosyltransferase involved in cell wall biosynthesis